MYLLRVKNFSKSVLNCRGVIINESCNQLIKVAVA